MLLALCGVASLGGGVGLVVWSVCLVVLLRAVVLVLARAARRGLLVAGPAPRRPMCCLGQARARLGCVVGLGGGCAIASLVVDVRGVLARVVAGLAQVLGRLGQARARLGCVILLAMRPSRRSNPTRPCFGGCCVTALLARVVVDARGVLARVVVVCMVGALARAWAVVSWGVWLALARARAVVVSWGVCLQGSGAPAANVGPMLAPAVLCA